MDVVCLRWLRGWGIGLLLALSCLGCGGTKDVTAVGTVLQGKQPIAPGPTGVVQVTLIPDVPAGADYTTYVGRCDATGRFEVTDVPPGRYKVAVQQLDPDPGTDVFAGAYGPDKTKFVFEIDGKQTVTIDLPLPPAE